MALKALLLCSVASMAFAGFVGPHGGSSVGTRKQDDFGNYAFSYQIVDGLGASNGRHEAGNGHGGVVGSYNIADIDGRSRRVDYIADAAGFRAKVKTNEPGTAASFPAAAVVASPYSGNFAYGQGHGQIGYGAGYGGYGGHGGYGAGHYGYGAAY